MNPSVRALLLHVIDANGAKYQQIKAAEEFAEASAAISRRVNWLCGLDDLAAELADTDVMREQLCLIYPGLDDAIAAQRKLKLMRLAQITGYDGDLNL